MIGVEGEFGNGFFYTANFTASEVKLRRDQSNYFIPQRMPTWLARGEFNFNDPYAMPDEF